MNIVFVYLVVLGCIGIVAEYGLVSLRKWLCPWYEASQ
jgi:ABC-type nitrate/sulfonate/bicarbonate transport system permease component